MQIGPTFRGANPKLLAPGAPLGAVGGINFAPLIGWRGGGKIGRALLVVHPLARGIF